MVMRPIGVRRPASEIVGIVAGTVSAHCVFNMPVPGR